MDRNEGASAYPLRSAPPHVLQRLNTAGLHSACISCCASLLHCRRRYRTLRDTVLLKALQLLLAAVLPLLERRTRAAERQAESAERLDALLRQYLGYSDPDFRRLLEGGLTAEQQAAADPPDVYHEEGAARDLKQQRLEELRALWFREHGELLDDERLVAEYDRLYTEAVGRLDPDQPAEVH